MVKGINIELSSKESAQFLQMHNMYKVVNHTVTKLYLFQEYSMCE